MSRRAGQKLPPHIIGERKLWMMVFVGEFACLCRASLHEKPTGEFPVVPAGIYHPPSTQRQHAPSTSASFLSPRILRMVGWLKVTFVVFRCCYRSVRRKCVTEGSSSNRPVHRTIIYDYTVNKVYLNLQESARMESVYRTVP